MTTATRTRKPRTPAPVVLTPEQLAAQAARDARNDAYEAQTPAQPLRHAWAVIKYNAQSGDTESTGDAALALIEPGICLLELSAAYRAAHAAHATAEAQFTGFPSDEPGAWDKARAAQSVMEAAKQALLSAALDIT